MYKYFEKSSNNKSVFQVIMNKTFKSRNSFDNFVDCSLTLQLRQKGK